MDVRAHLDDEDQFGLRRHALTAMTVVVMAGTVVGLTITRPPLGWIPIVAALPFATFRADDISWFWREWGTVYANVWIGLLVMVSGGMRSEAFILFTMNIVITAIVWPWATQLRSLASAVLAAIGGVVGSALATGEELGDPTAPLAVISGSILISIVVGRVVENGRRSDAALRGVYEQSGELIYRAALTPYPAVTDIAGSIGELTGLDPETVRGRPDVLLERMHDDDHQRLVLDHDRHLPSGRVDVRYRWRHGDGTWHWWEDRIVVLERDAGGRATVIQGVVRDVTEAEQTRLALETTLAAQRLAAADLERVDQLRTTFLQAVSHELRTPLTAIIGFSETMQRSNGRSETDQLLIGRISDNGHELRRLLDDLLDVDRLTRGSDQLDSHTGDVAVLVRRQIESTDLAGHHARYRGPRSLSAELDLMRLERIVSNLLRNAVRYTPSGCTVEVRLDAAGDDLTLVVSDDGPGVAEADRDRIFAPFEQGPGAASAPSPGTGIGLALVREFARAHDGRAWVETSSLGGAAFHVRIPGCIRSDTLHIPAQTDATRREEVTDAGSVRGGP